MAAAGEGGVDPLPPITPVLCFVDGDWPLFRAAERVPRRPARGDAVDPEAADGVGQARWHDRRPRRWGHRGRVAAQVAGRECGPGRGN